MSDKKDIKSLKYWCSQKTSDNKSRDAGWKGDCVGCCLFCDERDCDLCTCKAMTNEDLCIWRRTPAEWLLGRINEKAHTETCHRRRAEYYLRKGHIGEDSWIGAFLAQMKNRFGEDFGEKEVI